MLLATQTHAPGRIVPVEHPVFVAATAPAPRDQHVLECQVGRAIDRLAHPRMFAVREHDERFSAELLAVDRRGELQPYVDRQVELPAFELAFEVAALDPDRGDFEPRRLPRDLREQRREREARCLIDQARALVMLTAERIDSAGAKAARKEIAMIKVVVPNVTVRILDWAIQVHGGFGLSEDFPLARMYAGQRALRIFDGPDEVHRQTVAQLELAAQRSSRDAHTRT